MHVKEFIKPFKGRFKGSNYDSRVPPRKHLKNHHSCKLSTKFISKTLVERVRTGAVRVWSRVGTAEPPWVILPITIEPNKWRLCIDTWEWIYLIKIYPSAMVLQSMLTSSLLFCWLDHCFGPFDLKEQRLRLWPRNWPQPPGPVVALEVCIEMCDYLKVDVRRGYLFRPISPSGDILPGLVIHQLPRRG